MKTAQIIIRILFCILLSFLISCKENSDDTFFKFYNDSESDILLGMNIEYQNYGDGHVSLIYQDSKTWDYIRWRYADVEFLIKYINRESPDKAIFIEIFDAARVEEDWMTHGADHYYVNLLYGDGLSDLRFALKTVYHVDVNWLEENQWCMTYPYQGDTTISYYESINGKEIIRRDGYFGSHYEDI